MKLNVLLNGLNVQYNYIKFYIKTNKMQGVFNVDWDKALDPGLDESTMVKYQKNEESFRKVAAEVEKIKDRRKKRAVEEHTTARIGADAGSDDDDDEDDDDDASSVDAGPSYAHHIRKKKTEETHQPLPMPSPPDLEFTVHPYDTPMRIFVVPGEHKLRVGKFGHYLRPYVRTELNQCNPIDQEVDGQRTILPGSPGYPWPPVSILRKISDAEDKNAALLDIDEWSNNKIISGIDMNENLKKYESDERVEVLLAISDPTIFATNWKQTKNNDDSEADPNFPPDCNFAVEGVHFVRAGRPPDDPSPVPPLYALTEDTAPPFFEVGKDTLSASLRRAEELDFAFAGRIQGLLGAAQDHVWSCQDPDFVPSDRALAMHQFLDAYTKPFLAGAANDVDVRAVVTEQLQQHRAFSQEWVRKHYKCLTPAVTSPAESLVMEFYPQVSTRMSPPGLLSPAQLARYLMREPGMAAPFAHCLQYYMLSLENGRGGRNPSYKQMTSVSTFRAQSFKLFAQHFESKRPQMQKFYQDALDPHTALFHPYLIDWHSIVGKLPEVHRHYPRPDDAFLGGNRKKWNSSDAPWMYSR